MNVLEGCILKILGCCTMLSWMDVKGWKKVGSKQFSSKILLLNIIEVLPI